MKSNLKWLTRIKKSFKKIRLVDRCLIILMAILMIQSIYTLFVNEMNSQETNAVDTMVRTTSAAIFGYFLSANFIKKPEKKTENRGALPPEMTEEKDPCEQIVAKREAEQEEQTNHQQIIIAAIIGTVALCVLIFARNFVTVTPAMLASISQMRDFVSGCVGFLLGTPGQKNM